MPLDPQDPLVRQAIFGREVESFLQSKIGDFLLKRSQEEIEEAVTLLKKVSPWRRRRIMDLQNQIKVGEMFQSWLGDAVLMGLQAMELLEEDNAGG